MPITEENYIKAQSAQISDTLHSLVQCIFDLVES